MECKLITRPMWSTYPKKLFAISTLSSSSGSMELRLEWPWRARRYRISCPDVWLSCYVFLDSLLCWGGGRQRRPHSRCRSCADLPQTSCSWGRGKGTEERARSRKGGSSWRDRTHMDDHGDDMKDSNLSQEACVWRWRYDNLPERMRTTLSGCGCRCAHRAVPRKHRCCHWRSYRGVSRKHTCRHWNSRCALSPTRRFSPFLDFYFVPKFSSDCHTLTIRHNFYLTHFFHRGNTSFEVWYLHSRRL